MSALTQISYPYFRKGQVLKNTDLNNMVDYLDQQNRYTRVLVIGTGIFSGLLVDININQDSDPHVKLIIHQGFGLSSDGYLILMKKDDPNASFVYSGYRELNLSETEFRCKKTNVTNPPEPAIWNTYELIEQEVMESQKDETLHPLINLAEENEGRVEYCVILWISREEKGRPFCIDICDETGADLSIFVKPLLVKKSDLLKNSSENDVVFNDLTPPPNVKIHPFGYQEPSVQANRKSKIFPEKIVNPSMIVDYDEFLNNYINIISAALDEHPNIIDACDWVYNYMKILGLEGEQNPFNSLYNDLKEILKILSEPVIKPGSTPIHLEIQYLYLYLHDLKNAYEEFVNISQVINAAIFPDICSYPRYLCLCGLKVNKSETPSFVLDPVCRTPFQPSIFYEANKSRIREIEFYYMRLKMLTKISHHNNNGIVQLPLPAKGLDKIRITPGRSRQLPLSKQAIPYYYKKHIRNYWTYHSDEYCADMKILSYRDSNPDDVFPDQNPLLFQDDEFNFFRVEGHIGRNSVEVAELLNTWKDQFNLPFIIKVVYLNMVEAGREEFRSAEMSVLENKYIEIRQNLIDYIKSHQIEEPPVTVLPLRLIDFRCYDLSIWLKAHYGKYSKDESFNTDCYLYSLQMLRLSYDIESGLTMDLFRFSEFAHAHPGLQHLGGVQKGGTFVIVNAIALNEEVKMFFLNSFRLLNDKRYEGMVSIDRDAIRNYYKENATQLVVGDFSLPYQYCDAGRLIDPMIVLLPDKFCSNDEQSYEIWLYPAGGTVLATVDSANSNTPGLPDFISFDASLGKYFFNPSKVLIAEGKAMAEVLISYFIGGQPAITRVKVYLKPDESSIVWINEPLYDELNLISSQRISFTASFKGDFEAYWMIDGSRIANESGTTTTTLVREFHYQNKTQYLVSHVVLNGICKTRKDMEIYLCKMTGDISMKFEGEPLFTEDPENDEWVGIAVSPQGGKFRMWRTYGEYFEPNIQVQKGKDGTVKYHLVNSATNPLPAGHYFISYYLPFCGQEMNPLEFQVQNEPFIILDRYTFCSCDEHRHPVYIHPSDNQLVAKPDEGLIKEDNLYFFDPSAVTSFNRENIAKILLFFSLEGRDNVTRELTVYKVPDNIILLDSQPVYEGDRCFLTGYNYTFRANNGKSERYEWQFNDETIAVFDKNEKFECKIPLGRKHVVKLETETIIPPDDSSGIPNQPRVCRNMMIYDIKDLCPDAGKLSITVKKDDKEDDSYVITALPVGGKFSLVPVPEGSGTKIEDPPIYKNSEEPCSKATKFHFSMRDIDYIKFFPKGRLKIVYSFPDCNISVESDPVNTPEPVMQPKSTQKKKPGKT